MARWCVVALLGMTAALAMALWTAPASAQRQHTVRSGQSLARIARRHHVTVWDLALANRLRPNSGIRPGQVLTVPPRGVTYVRPGQTLSHVARDHHTSVEEIMRLNRMRRRRVRAGQRLVLPGFVEEADANRDWGQPDNPGVARIRRRGEVLTLTLRDAEGRVTGAALEGLASLMRRRDDDEAELPHPRLALLLAAISDHFGGREINLISGRREAGGYTRESSRHTSGHATDIQVRGVPRRVLWDYCRSLHLTGCGYYPRSTFVHVDVRARNGQWVDWSRPGASHRYGNLRGPWPRICRRRRTHRRCSRESRRVTRRDEVPEAVQLDEAGQRLMPTIETIGEQEEPEEEPSDEAEEDDEALDA